MDFDRLGDRLKKSQERIKGGAQQVRQIAVEAQEKVDGARVDRQAAREAARIRQAAKTKRALLILVPVIVVCFAALGILGAVEGGKKQAGAMTTPSASVETPVVEDTPSSVPTSAAPIESSPPAPALAAGATTTGLTGTYAESACDQYGGQQFPYGWDPHWITGRLADEAQGDTYYLKYTATVTNAYDAKQDINFECYVTGTNDSPTVSNFLAY